MKTGISWLDVKLGARMLLKNPLLTLVGGLGMAVAIAIGAGFFNATAAIASARLPLDDGDRVVALQLWDAEASNQERRILHDFVAWREELKTVRELGAFRTLRRNLIVPDQQTEQVAVAEMSASGFRVARVAPLLGRTLLDEDERPGAPPVIVIGEDVWRGRFASDPRIVGREVRLGTAVHTVVGVMPRGFAWPLDHRFWTPLQLNPADYGRIEGPGITVFGRLAPGATRAQAQAEVEAVGRRTAAAFPATHTRLRPRVLPYALGNDFADDIAQWQVQVLRVIVSLLLVVVCANVAILVYARTATRMGEIAVRSALGASRRRIVAQLFIEALVLSAGAAAVGLVAARAVLTWLATKLPARGSGEYPFWMDFRLTPGTVVYVLGLAVLAAVIVGVIPAVQATGSRLQAGLRQLGGGTGMRMGRTWTVLIVAQVAFAVAVLPTAVFGAWEWMRYGLTDPGFAAEQFLAASVGMDYETPPSARAAAYDSAYNARFGDRLDELAARLRAEPAVTDVALGSHVPGREPVMWVEVDGVATPTDNGDYAVQEGTAGHRIRSGHVDSRFFGLFGVPVLAGRGFGPADMDTAATAVVVSQSFVREVLGGANALGRRVRYVGRGGDAPEDQVQLGRWYEIVGVVRDFPNAMEPDAVQQRMYHPMVPGQVYPARLAVRMRGASAGAFTGRLREVTTAIDPTLRLGSAEPLDQSLRALQMTMRMTALGIGLVTLTVLLLSAAGMYALMSFTVTRRRREIGIRAALGADPRRILRGIFSRALGQLGIGVGVGLAAAVLLNVATGGATMGDKAPLLIPAVSALMVAVGLLATAGPARQAMRVQPMEALREE
ncbi:MAG TPA: ABC transporter permease [Longimicrobium sp.]|uniref:ABC transporter permease n=1 Tax=Longimicrobium sp. TaxID=2029185 RepID=UPI002ED7B479